MFQFSIRGRLTVTLVAGALVVAFLVTATWLWLSRAQEVEASAVTLDLAIPAFVTNSAAQVNPASFLESEAGIAAYFRSSVPISLNAVRSLYRTIEAETSDYIIGSIPVADYPETHDVRVYMHRQGWVVAYYLRGDPTAKILNLRRYHETGRNHITTKLEDTLALIAGAAGLPFPGPTYYHFGFPSAAQMTIVMEYLVGPGVDDFSILLPATFAYYERSWAYTSNSIGFGHLLLNGAQLASSLDRWVNLHGSLSGSQLPPDQFHKFELGNPSLGGSFYAGIVILYRRP